MKCTNHHRFLSAVGRGESPLLLAEQTLLTCLPLLQLNLLCVKEKERADRTEDCASYLLLLPRTR